MPFTGIAQGLGIGGGATATISGAPAAVAGGFKIDVFDLKANILGRSGDEIGVIAFGTDTYDIYVFDGTNWQTYENS
jgi:hypothetical protein